MPCSYGGQQYSDGSQICQAGRVMVCAGGNWSDTGRDCATTPVIVSDEDKKKIEAVLKKFPDSAELPPPGQINLLVNTTYSLTKFVSVRNDQVWGQWSDSIGGACGGFGQSGYVFRVQLISVDDAGECHNDRITKIVFNA